MMPIAHLIFAFLLGSTLQHFGVHLDLGLFSLLGTIVDLDIVHSRYHRTDSITHFPLFWLALLPLFWEFGVAIYLLAIMSHFVLDTVDYGVNWLWPFRNRLYGLKWNGLEEVKGMTFFEIISTYVKNKRMIAMEIVIAAIGLAVLIGSH